ncbi:MAG TPA: hypothetical protein VGF94_10710 [Kofleriaceae bacterium]|jgi:hypothetical protein
MRLALSIVAAGALVGCAIDDDSVSDQSQSIVALNRLASNRLASNRLASNRLASNRLTSGPHIGGGLSLSDVANSLVDDGAQDVLAYMVGCALPDGVVVYDKNGAAYSGEIGVAPDWTDRSLSERDVHWLSACLFARVNDEDVAVPISMRGDNSALSPDPDELANWTLQQGAFYGNYFTPLDQPILWAACSGTDDTTSEQRICAQPDPMNPGYTLCGFIYTGACQSSDRHRGFGWWHHHHDSGACERFDSHGTYFEDCNLPVTENFYHGRHDVQIHFDESIDEAITVYVHP